MTASAIQDSARRANRLAALERAKAARAVALERKAVPLLTDAQARHWASVQTSGGVVPEEYTKGDSPEARMNIARICAHLPRPPAITTMFNGFAQVLVGDPTYIRQCAVEDEGNAAIQRAESKALRLEELADEVEVLHERFEPGVSVKAGDSKRSVLVRSLWTAAAAPICKAHAANIRALATDLRRSARQAAESALAQAKTQPRQDSHGFAYVLRRDDGAKFIEIAVRKGEHDARR